MSGIYKDGEWYGRGGAEMPAEDMSEVASPMPSAMSRRFKYSTEEQVVGEWIDGSPIYQKTWTGLRVTFSGTGWIRMPFTIQNVNRVLDAQILRASNNSLYAYIDISPIAPNIDIAGHETRDDIHTITLWYTKTTD